MDDLSLDRALDIGAFFHAASDVHRRLSDFIHQVVVNRRDEAVRGWRNWIREDPLVHPYRWLRPDLVPPAPFPQCEPCLTPDGSGVLSDPARIDEEFRKGLASLFFFAVLCKGRPALTNSALRLRVGGRFYLKFIFPRSLVRCLLLLYGWGWRELKALPLSWYDELARILTKVADLGVCLMGCWMLILQ